VLNIAVLCGGYGTRLREVLGSIPKVLAPVGGQPFLGLLLKHLIHELGPVGKFLLLTGYQAEKVEQTIGYIFGSSLISYCIEAEPEGTWNAFVNASQHFRESPFLLVNGDTYPINMSLSMQIFEDSIKDRNCILFGVRRDTDGGRYTSLVSDDDDYLIEMRKVDPSSHDDGVGSLEIVSSGWFFWPGGQLEKSPDNAEFNDVLLQNIRCGLLKVRVVVVEAGKFIDIGVPTDYRLMSTYLGDQLS
tara:strand:- start:1956 stop:2690 length:735 start_codon:yes stop_codon:yes gene_type:complete